MPTSIRKEPGFVVEAQARSPFADVPNGWTDLSLEPKWRTFVDPSAAGCAMGRSILEGERLIWRVSPIEWTVLGSEPAVEAVDLTDVRALLRIPSPEAVAILPALCALDFDERMFPIGGAVRTAVAGVATEIVREPDAFLLAVSRSYARYFAASIQAHRTIAT